MTAGNQTRWLILFAKLFLFSVLLLALGCLVAFEVRRHNRLTQLEKDEVSVIAAQVAAVNDALHQIRADLLILSRQSELNHAAPGNRALDDLAREYADFARAVGVYENIRLFTAAGTLLIDIQDEGGDVRFHSLSGRGDAAERADIRALSSMALGGLLMSRPYRVEDISPRPLIRFGIGVMANGNTLAKAALVSFRADVLFDHLAQLAVRSPSTFILMDRGGQWVSRSDASYTWGFDRHDGHDSNLEKRYPAAWNAIATQEGGILEVLLPFALAATLALGLGS